MIRQCKLLLLVSALALLTGLVSPVQARLTLGVVEEANLLAPREAQLRLLADYLAAQLGQEVRIRLFREPANLIQWMTRHREIDLAVLHHEQVRRLPAGEVLPVADFQRRGQAGLAMDQLVAGQSLSAAQRTRLQQILTDMERTPAGRRTLEQLGVERFVAPGSGQARLAEVRPPAPAPAPPAPRVAPRPAARPAARAPTPPAREVKPAPAPPRETEAPVAPAPSVAAPPAPQPGAEPPRIWADEPAAPPAAQTPPESKPKAAEPPVAEPVPAVPAPPAPVPAEEPPVVPAPAPAPPPSPPAAVEIPIGPADKVIPPWRVALDALLVLGALGATFWFFRRRRRLQAQAEAKRRPARERRDHEGYLEVSEASFIDGADLATPPTPPRAAGARVSRGAISERAPKTPAPAVEIAGDFCALNPAQLQGELDLPQVFSLLRMIADYPRPGTLVVRSPHDEKRIHFRNGHLCAAFSLNLANRAQAGFLMNKLGYLLVRMGLVSEEQRDRALEVCSQQPGLRLGEVLVQSGALAPADLKRALRTQAEGVVLSLFLFPVGRFEVVGETLDINLDDDLGIAAQDILKEAARYQEEWDGLRRSLPSLDTVIAYDEAGRDKLDVARMTVHQKLVLSLVDGRRSLKDICREATMLDFEVYKFIYLMVRARILKPVVEP